MYLIHTSYQLALEESKASKGGLQKLLSGFFLLRGHSRPPRDPPPFMAKTILNFHFDYWTPP